MIFRQITHDDLGCASYLIGDEKAGVAAVVDPRFEVDEYLELARYMGVSIEHIFETHNHADHVSGHGRLRAATGATIHIHREAAPEYEHEPFDDGDEFELGTLRIRALHTPGHRPEHTAFALIDTRRSEQPWAVLTGDTLFVNDVARPDLAIEKSEGARGIFRSLNDKLLVLAPEVEIWPGHLGGSMCGGPGHGHEGLLDDRLRARAQPDAVDHRRGSVRRAGARQARSAAAELPGHRRAQPGPAADRRRRISGRSRRVRSTSKRSDGALLVDVRTDQQYDDAHIPGAISIPMLNAGFGSKLAWLADREQEIVFIGRDDEDGRHAGKLAVAVGIRKLAGFLHGGMTSWRQEKRPVERIERVALDDLPARVDSPSPRSRCSTCASKASGTPATSPARPSSPGTTSTPFPTGWTRPSRSPSSAAPGSGRRPRRASSSTSAAST